MSVITTLARGGQVFGEYSLTVQIAVFTGLLLFSALFVTWLRRSLRRQRDRLQQKFGEVLLVALPRYWSMLRRVEHILGIVTLVVVFVSFAPRVFGLIPFGLDTYVLFYIAVWLNVHCMRGMRSPVEFRQAGIIVLEAGPADHYEKFKWWKWKDSGTLVLQHVHGRYEFWIDPKHREAADNILSEKLPVDCAV